MLIYNTFQYYHINWFWINILFNQITFSENITNKIESKSSTCQNKYLNIFNNKILKTCNTYLNHNLV